MPRAFVRNMMRIDGEVGNFCSARRRASLQNLQPPMKSLNS